MTLSIMVIIIMLSAFMLAVVILNVVVPRGGKVKRPQHEQNSISSQRNTNRNRKIIA
jgi:hypothetical protein